MTLSISPKTKRLIERHLKQGEFGSAEEVIIAGLSALQQKGSLRFEPDELNRLLDEGEDSIRREGTLDGDKALADRRRKRAPSGRRGS